jgi:hypothetical protein
MYADTGRRVDAATLLVVDRLIERCVDTSLPPGPGGCRMTHVTDSNGLDVLRPLLGEVFPAGAWLKTMVVALHPSQQIQAHVDAPIAGVRYHMAIRVNEGCWVLHAGAWRQLEPGRVYRMDPTEEHGAVNWGASVRWHLMVDIQEES